MKRRSPTFKLFRKKYRKWKISLRLKVAFSLSIWIGMVMGLGSLLFAAVMGGDLEQFYFGESNLFYEIAIVLAAIFTIGFLLAGYSEEK